MAIDFFSIAFLVYCLIDYSFLDHTDAVSSQKFFQVFDLSHQFASLVRVFHHQSLGTEFYNLCGRLDGLTFFDGLLHGSEWFVLYQLEASGVEFQRVSSNAGFQVIGFGVSAVVYH